ncbi:hypothetical protein [Sphingomonas paucimobilis]|uniref:Uncharacterized protein n=1 Tax=Sphingomonas paucimobilis TaxID=13689 RepID=A0A7T3ABM4_SPHPI|nr:hypothetical protein [Sphingomonas paucimobilis]QPT09724.1 hypothetical protein I6G38_05565 [Sphingomonas paucimobilis]
MRFRKALLYAALIAASTTAATAQVKRAGSVVNSPAAVEITLPDGSYITPPAFVPLDTTGAPTGAGRQELVQLATSNTAAPAATVFGGTYILTQACSAYGAVVLRYRGPDGTTMIALLIKTSAEAGGTTVQLGSKQVVDVALTSTTGCNVTLARVP